MYEGTYGDCILYQSDERRAVGIVLDCFNSTLYVKLVALEVDDTIFSSVAAASVTNCNSSVAVTSCLLI